MDRAKIRLQTQRLRNKKLIQMNRVAKAAAPKTKAAQTTPKAQVKNGVVKLRSFSSKKTASTTPSAPPASQSATVKPKRTGGCGGCRRKLGKR